MHPGLRILFLAAEASPFVKIGGLGDVAGSLPAALRAISPHTSNSTEGPLDAEVDVRLVIPFHGVIQRHNYPLRKVTAFSLPYSGGVAQAEVFSLESDHLPVYLISGSLIPPDAPVYTSDASVDGMKFTFFSLAALEMARILEWTPDIVHANDWHTSPAIYSLSLDRDPGSFYYNTATVLGLHNLPYLGVGAGPALAAFSLPPASGSALPKWAQELPLPLGLLGTDQIVAPSPNYAQEILTPEFGSGLDQFLQTRAKSISGILNGLDVERWDPRTDADIPANYGLDEIARRQANKLALQRELILAPDPGKLLFAMVSRLDNQKGVDLVPEALRMIANRPWQAVILGTGDPLLETAVQKLEEEFPDRVRAVIRFDSALSRRFYAGADALLIPSRYEPCGLTQMIAMRYGCVPIARATGGLYDTIFDYSRSAESTGFLFSSATPTSLAAAMERALELFTEQEVWESLQRRGMQQDFSWARAAQQYLALYQRLAETRRVR